MKSFIAYCIHWFQIPFFLIIILPLIAISRLLRLRIRSPRLMWGTDPLISNKYWSEALKIKGYASKTVMDNLYSINKMTDYDMYIDDLILKTKNSILKQIIYLIRPYYSFVYIIFNFDIIHHPFNGIVLKRTPIWFFEAQLLKIAGIKSIVLPYGGDFYKYSEVLDPSLRHVLLVSYYKNSIKEPQIKKVNNYWLRYTDAILPCFQLDGNGRWDALPFNPFIIDIIQWKPKTIYSIADGKNGTVNIVHTPNHRGFKGTEFIIKAVEDLQNEGLLINLILIEKKSNDEVRRIMFEEADILVEQIIATAYAMSGIEGMATGIPVIAGLENSLYTQVFRRYSYLNECPVLSGSPENIKDQIRLLVTNPKLRETLGKSNRQYVEKYHSYETAGYMFDKLYQKIWFNKPVETINMFHPLMPDSYNNSRPLIKHPLVKNHYIQ